MKRILVPLDGSRLAESILPDAVRLAGSDGEILLVRDVNGFPYDLPAAFQEADAYLQTQAAVLQAQGVKAESKVLGLYDRAWAIDEAARIHNADIIACATHGRGPFGRVMRGSVAWRALSHSDVPILFRHPHTTGEGSSNEELPTRRILVPLDGSQLAEKALPLALEVADRLNASIRLVQVIPTLPPQSTSPRGVRIGIDVTNDIKAAHQYLEKIATALPGKIETAVLRGGVVDTLVDAVENWNITDVVMASHGHTGLMRVIVGSVADALIHRLHCPIIVIPAHAASLIAQPEVTVRAGELTSTRS